MPIASYEALVAEMPEMKRLQPATMAEAHSPLLMACSARCRHTRDAEQPVRTVMLGPRKSKAYDSRFDNMMSNMPAG